jgi:hypothetical protein
MVEQIEREVILPATPEEVWAQITRPDWLADEAQLALIPGGDASFCVGETRKTGWVEEVSPPLDGGAGRLAFWWAAEGEAATRVELTVEPAGWAGSRLRVIETRPMQALELIGSPLGGIRDSSYGPTLLAA